MAGEDREFEGRGWCRCPALTHRLLPQEPQLDPGQTVREAGQQGMADVC